MDKDSIFIETARANPISTHQSALHLTGTVFVVISLRLGGLFLSYTANKLNDANAGSLNSRLTTSHNNHNLEPNQGSVMLSRL